MLNWVTQFAKKLWTQLSHTANRLFRRILEPAQSNLVTGTLADLPRRCIALIAENALLRQQDSAAAPNATRPVSTYLANYGPPGTKFTHVFFLPATLRTCPDASVS